MPILDAVASPQLDRIGIRPSTSGSGVRVPSIDGNLPSWTQVKEDIKSNLASDAQATVQADYQARFVKLANQGAQLSTGATIGTVGVPKGQKSINPSSIGEGVFDGVTDLLSMDEFGLDVAEEFTQTLAPLVSKGLEEGLELVGEQVADMVGPALDASMNVIGAIPVAGWIVKVAYGFGKAIKRLVDLTNAQEQKQDLRDVWSGYSPQLDLATVNQHVWPRYVDRNVDLNGLFSPPGRWDAVTGYAQTGGGFRFQELKEPGGWRVVSRSFGEQRNDRSWLGVVPGANTCHIAIEARKDGKTATDYGRMFPSSAQVAAGLWGQLNQPTPLMYSVNASLLRQRWLLYMWHLRKSIVEVAVLGQTVASEPHPGEKWAKAAINELTGTLGWKPWQGKDGERIVTPDVEDVWGLEQSVPLKALDLLHRNQQRLRRTLLCAYLDPKQSAFQTQDMFTGVSVGPDASMWSAVGAAQQKLLTHPARCLVDLDSVPDTFFRADIYNAAQTCPPKWTLLNVEPFTQALQVELANQDPPPPGPRPTAKVKPVFTSLTAKQKAAPIVLLPSSKASAAPTTGTGGDGGSSGSSSGRAGAGALGVGAVVLGLLGALAGGR